MGVVLAYLKITPYWKPFEAVTAKKFLVESMGLPSWETLWEPLFQGKFQKYASKISAAWFWARIKKRTPSLAYPKGGFLEFAQNIDKAIRQLNGKINYKTSVEKIFKKGGKVIVKTGQEIFEFDKVIVTLPSPIYLKIVGGLSSEYKKKLMNLTGIGAVNLLLSLNKKFLKDGTYWLNINERDYPFLAVVEHTNFMNKKYYNNENLVYVGNYLPHEHPYYQKDANSLLKEFTPYLKKINPEFDRSWVNDAYLFKAFFAQPIIPLNYSKLVPDFKTPIEGVYLCNIQQVYPWDRGTNYAVENGKKVARMVIGE
jgi:protoporphyrinogen oxidase